MKLVGNVCLLLILSQVESNNRACTFNALCSCSNAGSPDLGSVCCDRVPLLTVPPSINKFTAYILYLRYNGLRFLEDHGLNGTGLYKLKITHNLLTSLPPNALGGLDRTLSILDLSKNKLDKVPKEAMQNLEKLTTLNLAGNQIGFLQSEDLRNVGKTLKVLDLSENALMHIQNDAFRNMVVLEVLNLGQNSLVTIDDITFQGGLNNLKHIILKGNQLQQIPLNALATLKEIRIVNLNKNLISSISEGREIRSKIDLEELHLENNLIRELTGESFRLFSQVNRIFLKGNPLTMVNETFKMANVTEIYMPHCSIGMVTKNAFLSGTHSLQVLDLSYNNLREFVSFPLTKLTKLSVAGNEVNELVPEDFKYYGSSLKYLDIVGSKMNGLSQESMMYLPNLRELSFSKMHAILNPEYLQTVSPLMEKLHITRSSIKGIENGAFYRLSGLKQLDLSYNSISKIENATFRDVKHSLEKLILHNALRMQTFPHKALNSLSKLEYLDVSSNRLSNLPQEAFSTLQNLNYLNLNHNQLKDLEQNFANDLHNPKLEYLKIAFNKLTTLKPHSFRNLEHLTLLQINDNLIENIKRTAFLDLDSIITIRLEGNMIENIENEAFINLPKIQFINLAYNKLSSLNLEAFNQVGRLSTLKIDVQHNNIQNLTGNYTATHTSSNIKSIDFSSNNISYIDENYFDPIRLSVTILDLSNNIISNLTNAAFINMAHLQILNLSNNFIDIIEEEEFDGLSSIQMLDLSNNQVKELPENLFSQQQNLRIFSLSSNNLETLPKEIFTNTKLEQLDISFNNFRELPEEAVFQIKNTIQLLDISQNQIKAINFSRIASLDNLRMFYLAQNNLQLANSDEFHLSNLISFDLSHNLLKELPDWIASHLPRSLEILNLANTSIKSFPLLNSCNILVLNLSSNAIESIEAEALEQLKKIQTLDLSNNSLSTTYNNIWSNLQQLKTLYLQENPIQKLLNNSFSSMERLQELYIKNLDLQEIHQDVFQYLTGLKKLEMDTYPTKNINMSQMLSKNNGIQDIHLHVQENELEGIFSGNLPKSIKSITLEGENLRHLDESAFSNIQSRNLMLIIKNSNITKLSKKLFQNMKEVKNFTLSFMNNKLQMIEKMLLHENEDKQKYLKELKLSGNQLTCSCEFSWVWEWLREYEYENNCDVVHCEEINLYDLRETKCINMNNQSIIDVFKTKLDCFSNGAVNLSFGTLIPFILSMTLIYFNNKYI